MHVAILAVYFAVHLVQDITNGKASKEAAHINCGGAYCQDNFSYMRLAKIADEPPAPPLQG